MPNFARRGSRQSMEPKAVLEHRAPKTSPPILHSRGVESKVGRPVHCAPVWVMLTRLSRARIPPSAPLRARLRASNLLVREKHPVDSASGGQWTARPTRDRVLTKFHRRRGSRPSNLWKRLFGGFNEAKPPMRFTLRVKFNLDWFGRAEHCAHYPCFH